MRFYISSGAPFKQLCKMALFGAENAVCLAQDQYFGDTIQFVFTIMTEHQKYTFFVLPPGPIFDLKICLFYARPI